VPAPSAAAATSIDSIESEAVAGAGVSLFDADVIDDDILLWRGPMTDIIEEDDTDLMIESVGGSSGLLDLTRESDDTSLGAELLDEIYPTQAKSAPPARPAPATVASRKPMKHDDDGAVFDSAILAEPTTSGLEGIRARKPAGLISAFFRGGKPDRADNASLPDTQSKELNHPGNVGQGSIEPDNSDDYLADLGIPPDEGVLDEIYPSQVPMVPAPPPPSHRGMSGLADDPGGARTTKVLRLRNAAPAASASRKPIQHEDGGFRTAINAEPATGGGVRASASPASPAQPAPSKPAPLSSDAAAKAIADAGEKARGLVPDDLMKKYLVIPLSEENGRLKVLVHDPNDLEILDNLRFRLNREIEAVVAPREQIKEHLDRKFNTTKDSIDKTMRELSIDGTSQSIDIKGLTVDSAGDRSAEELEAESAPIIRLLNHIIYEAIQAKTSDIHIEPFADRVRLRYRIDGKFHEREQIPKRTQRAIIARLKIMAGRKVEEKRLPQEGVIKMKIDDKIIDFHVSFCPVYHGESVVMRVLPTAPSKLAPENQGIRANPSANPSKVPAVPEQDDLRQLLASYSGGGWFDEHPLLKGAMIHDKHWDADRLRRQIQLLTGNHRILITALTLVAFRLCCAERRSLWKRSHEMALQWLRANGTPSIVHWALSAA
jgi:hypothetical protein